MPAHRSARLSDSGMRGVEKHAWGPGPFRPKLADGSVHVWRVDLTSVGNDPGELLCSDERARAERFVNDRDGELWRRSRGLLRELLGRYLRQDPRSLRFAPGEQGKPRLRAERAPGLAFNMSHSGQLALYAFSRAPAVGVDIEVERRPIDEVAIARRTLGASEAARLGALDPTIRRLEFMRAWTRYEAELKCLGVGLSGVDADVDRSGLWVAELDLGPGAAGAIASAWPICRLHCWEWQPTWSR